MRLVDMDELGKDHTLILRKRYYEMAQAEGDLVVVKAQRNALLAAVTFGGHCKVCNGFADKFGDAIPHQEDCPASWIAGEREEGRGDDRDQSARSV